MEEDPEVPSGPLLQTARRVLPRGQSMLAQETRL